MNRKEQLAKDGYVIVGGVFGADEYRRFAAEIQAALQACDDQSASLRRANGTIYGARNLLDLYPPARELWRRPPIVELLSSVLGPTFGLVRGLYFDKPPQGSWSLPWHRDLTIAVEQHGHAPAGRASGVCGEPGIARWISVEAVSCELTANSRSLGG